MNYLTVFNSYERKLIDSRQVSKFVGKRHDHLLRDIRKYIKIIEDSPTLNTAHFFIESTYLNSQKKVQPCYLLTKLGCDMVANKMIGEKGVLFTAEYVTKFYEMEEKFKLRGLNSIQTYADALRFAAEHRREKAR